MNQTVCNKEIYSRSLENDANKMIYGETYAQNKSAIEKAGENYEVLGLRELQV